MTEPKITREEIEAFLKTADEMEKRYPGFDTRFSRALCTLALQAEAMQPRRIEEYKVGSGDALVYDGAWQEAHYERSASPPFWSTDIYDLAPEGTARKYAIEPTHFILLTSLPEPRR